jgi:hypothetical protein
MLFREAVKHLLVPLAEISSAVVCEGETDFLVFGEPGATDGDDFVAFGFDDANVFDASGFGTFDCAVASKDAIIFVDDDGACGAVALQGFFDQLGRAISTASCVFMV